MSKNREDWGGENLMETTGTRILIVDDDATSRRLLEVRLRSLRYEVTMTANGQEALTAIRSEVPVS